MRQNINTAANSDNNLKKRFISVDRLILQGKNKLLSNALLIYYTSRILCDYFGGFSTPFFIHEVSVLTTPAPVLSRIRITVNPALVFIVYLPKDDEDEIAQNHPWNQIVYYCP